MTRNDRSSAVPYLKEQICGDYGQHDHRREHQPVMCFCAHAISKGWGGLPRSNARRKTLKWSYWLPHEEKSITGVFKVSAFRCVKSNGPFV